MTVVKIKKEGCFNRSFELIGHAGYNLSGPDIVCAAISMATQMTLIGLDEVVNAKYTFQGDAAKGYMCIKVTNIMDDATKALLDTLEAALKVLASQYPQNIQIYSH